MERPVTHATICVLHRYDGEPARFESLEWLAVRICTVSGNGYLVSTVNYSWQPADHLQWLRDHTRASPGAGRRDGRSYTFGTSHPGGWASADCWRSAQAAHD